MNDRERSELIREACVATLEALRVATCSMPYDASSVMLRTWLDDALARLRAPQAPAPSEPAAHEPPDEARDLAALCERVRREQSEPAPQAGAVERLIADLWRLLFDGDKPRSYQLHELHALLEAAIAAARDEGRREGMRDAAACVRVQVPQVQATGGACSRFVFWYVNGGDCGDYDKKSLREPDDRCVRPGCGARRDQHGVGGAA